MMWITYFLHRSDKFSLQNLAVRIRFTKIQTVQNPGKLLSGHSEIWLSVILIRPLEMPFFQPAVIQSEPILVPVEDFNLIFSAIAEHEKTV